MSGSRSGNSGDNDDGGEHERFAHEFRQSIMNRSAYNMSKAARRAKEEGTPIPQQQFDGKLPQVHIGEEAFSMDDMVAMFEQEFILEISDDNHLGVGAEEYLDRVLYTSKEVELPVILCCYRQCVSQVFLTLCPA